MRDYPTAVRLILFAMMVTSASACSTYYQESRQLPMMNSSSGYQEEKGPGGLIKVIYQGNNAIRMYQVEDYTLYRCAEIASREGSPYFALYQTLPDALNDRRSDAVRPTTLLGIPHAEVYIGLRKTAEPGLLSTNDVLAKLAPSIKRRAR